MDETLKPLTSNDIFLTIFKHPYFLKCFLNDFVNEEWAKNVETQDITYMNANFENIFKFSRKADIIARIDIKDENQEALQQLYIIVLLEHQSKVDYLMPFRLLEYMVAIWREVLNTSGLENGYSAAAQNFKFPYIAPLVFYEGKTKWDAALNFAECFWGSEKLSHSSKFKKIKDYIPTFCYTLIELRSLSPKTLRECGDALAFLLLLDKLETAADLEETRRYYTEQKEVAWGKLKKALQETDVWERFAACLTGILRRRKLDQVKIEEFLAEIKQGRPEFMLENAFREWGELIAQKQAWEQEKFTWLQKESAWMQKESALAQALRESLAAFFALKLHTDEQTLMFFLEECDYNKLLLIKNQKNSINSLEDLKCLLEKNN